MTGKTRDEGAGQRASALRSDRVRCSRTVSMRMKWVKQHRALRAVDQAASGSEGEPHRGGQFSDGGCS